MIHRVHDQVVIVLAGQVPSSSTVMQQLMSRFWQRLSYNNLAVRDYSDHDGTNVTLQAILVTPSLSRPLGLCPYLVCCAPRVFHSTDIFIYAAAAAATRRSPPFIKGNVQTGRLSQMAPAAPHTIYHHQPRTQLRDSSWRGTRFRKTNSLTI